MGMGVWWAVMDMGVDGCFVACIGATEMLGVLTTVPLDGGLTPRAPVGLGGADVTWGLGGAAGVTTGIMGVARVMEGAEETVVEGGGFTSLVIHGAETDSVMDGVIEEGEMVADGVITTGAVGVGVGLGGSGTGGSWLFIGSTVG